ncbi:hypothetical protein TWF481_006285 [Arthrobotrys musiformis]|uniref:Uncharacterized protein n=1 Tax=Arthrobotrys musiformis TaxID=47236 RepID=A0AAV9WGE8_9PEZI
MRGGSATTPARSDPQNRDSYPESDATPGQFGAGRSLDSLAAQPKINNRRSITSVPSQASTKLYRATTLERARRFYNQDTGIFDEPSFGSRPGDLSGLTPLTYWTPQREVADAYAGYLKHRIPFAKITITEVEVGEQFLETLRPVCLWATANDSMNPVFQEFTWLSRNERDFHQIPPRLRFLSDCNILIANILAHKNIKYERTEDWRLIERSDLLEIKIDGENRLGIQWVFRSRESREAFEQHCRGNVKQNNINMLAVSEVSEMAETMGRQ